VPWSPIEAVPVAVLAIVPLVLIGSLVRLGDTGELVAGLMFELLLVGATVLWIRARHPGSVALLGLGPGRRGRHVLLGALSGLGLFAATFIVVTPLYVALLSLLAGHPIVLPEQPVLPDVPSTFQVVLGGVVALLAAPVGEEVFFRGFLFTGLRSRFRFVVAAALSAAAFALFHVTPLHLPLFFFVGLGLAYVYDRHGTLWASISAHMAFNVVGYVLIATRVLAR
jgi:membrane protease YdiL (CAAX protease family)